MMATKGNRFGIGPVDPVDSAPRKARDVGPMGAAVRDAASSLQASSDAMVEQRRQNAVHAKEFRQAQDEGRVLIAVPLAAISTADLPRDRMDLGSVAASDEMEELKASIRVRGQKEPIEVYRDAGGQLHLKKGWRRLSALQQLFAETGEDRFATVLARVAEPAADRLDLYIDMVEENVIREDLTFAEMAQVAIDAARDLATGVDDADLLVGRLYASLHKMKRSYIRAFVALLGQLGDDLRFPKAVARNLGVDVVRRLKEDPPAVEGLRLALAGAADATAQNAILTRFCAGVSEPVRAAPTAPREKFEFHCGAAKVTARAGECRIKSRVDFSALERAVLERAVNAFNKIVEQG
jgi:ParB family chromosome partitioning protein